MNIVICKDPKELASSAIKILLHRSQLALEQNRRCSVALSGGRTPKFFYESLVKHCEATPAADVFIRNIDWFFSDERFVDPSSHESNYKLAHDALFSKLAIDNHSIFPVSTIKVEPSSSARLYEEEIKTHVNNKENPTFDLIFLGMGRDGHTASLFSDTDLVQNWTSDRTDLVAAVFVRHLNSYRITFTPKLINQALHVVVMISGEDKAATIRDIVQDNTPECLPIQLICPENGIYDWILDASAAVMLELHKPA